MHFLGNGHPAHVFTLEDRRKAAAITNQIRREKRALFELRLNRRMEQMLAKDEARRERRAEKHRRRRNEQKARYWIERGFGARY
jgi:hypothetical protein